MGKPCSPATFSHIILTFASFKLFQILYSNATDLKLVSSTYFSPLFPFLVLTKCKSLNLRVGRSRDPQLQRAQVSYLTASLIHLFLNGQEYLYYELGSERVNKHQQIWVSPSLSTSFLFVCDCWSYFRGSQAIQGYQKSGTYSLAEYMLTVR